MRYQVTVRQVRQITAFIDPEDHDGIGSPEEAANFVRQQCGRSDFGEDVEDEDAFEHVAKVVDVEITSKGVEGEQQDATVSVVYEQQNLESGSIVGTVEYNGRCEQFDFSWGSHESYWFDNVDNQCEDKWYGEVMEEICDAVREEFERQYDWDMDCGPVKATVIYDTNGVRVTELTVPT